MLIIWEEPPGPSLGPGSVAVTWFEGREPVPGRGREAADGGGPLRKSVAASMPDTERLFSLSHPGSGLRFSEVACRVGAHPRPRQ